MVYCRVIDDWLERYVNAKRELAFRTYSCLIGTHAPVLEVLSDRIYNITELAQGDDVKGGVRLCIEKIGSTPSLANVTATQHGLIGG